MKIFTKISPNIHKRHVGIQSLVTRLLSLRVTWGAGVLVLKVHERLLV